MSRHAIEFGKGAVKAPSHITATRYKLLASAVPTVPVDWSKPFTIENGFTLVQRDQKSSSSCTAQATCYYIEALNHINGKAETYSARYNYSKTFITGGGAYIWKAMAVPLKGSASSVSVPDGDSSEATMEDASHNASAIIEARAEKYASIAGLKNIDTFASVLEKYHGFVSGFNGNNEVFSPDGTYNIPLSVDWGHCIFFVGHECRDHRDQHGNLLHANEKMLKFKNSWTSGWGTNGYGYIPECAINAGCLFDPGVYADVKDIDPQSMVLTADDVRFLQALEGYSDEGGVVFWTGKTLAQYKAQRVGDKIKGLQALKV